MTRQGTLARLRVNAHSPLRARQVAVAAAFVVQTLAAPAGAQQVGAPQRDSARAASQPVTADLPVIATPPTAAELPVIYIPPVAKPHGGANTLRLAAGLGAAAIAIAPFDVAITRKLRSPELQRSTVWHDGAVVFDWYGAPGARAVGPLLAVAGSVARNSTLSDIGIHVSESYAASALVVYTLKGFAGRARPYTVSSESAYDFRFGRGFPHDEPYSSFPSGHSTGSFAFASSITVEAARRWPAHKVLVGALAYSGAFLDGVSRVYRDTHWPSDVAAGALVGTITGLVVTRHQHAHPDNRLDAFARRVLFAPAADGRLAVGLAETF
jgi:membrane-associated phospholipid phosphatase